jgi:hypothetical protein
VSPSLALLLSVMALLAVAEIWPYVALLIAWLLGKAARRLSAHADAGRGGARATCTDLAPLRALALYDDAKAREEFSRCLNSSGIALPRRGAARIGAKGGKQKQARASPGAQRHSPHSHP